MKKTRILAIAIALLLLSTICVFADGFNFVPEITRGKNAITVEIEENEALRRKPTLWIPLAGEWETVFVYYDEETTALDITLRGEEVGFIVEKAGVYTIQYTERETPPGPGPASGGSEEIVQEIAEESAKDYIQIADTTYKDIQKDAWYAEAVGYVTDEGLFAGTGNGNFSPNTPVNRAMVMTVLAKYDGHDCSTTGNWWDEGLKWAVEKGVSDGSNPLKEIPREQMIVMLWNYAGKPESDYSLEAYNDTDEISTWALTAIKWAIENKVITGTSKGAVAPGSVANRAQLAQIMMNYCKLLSKTAE